MPDQNTLLLILFVAFFLLAFVIRAVLVYRNTGINPLVLRRTQDAYGYVGTAFKVIMLVCAAVVSLLWMLIAQAQMGASWRVGIDSANRTELVSKGLFTISRNPIFLATRLALLGFFLVAPNAATLAVAVAKSPSMSAGHFRRQISPCTQLFCRYN